MRTASTLSEIFGEWVGTGPGTGMGIILLFCGVLSALVGAAGYFIPAIHNAELILPDHDQLAKVEPEAAPA